jgi:hypothetical protein
LLQQHIVAPSLDPNHTQTARTGFILRHRDVFGWHLASQARTLLVAVRHDSLFNATVDLLLRPRGGADTPMETCEPHAQTHQAHPTGTHFGPHQVDRQNESMQEGETGDTLKKGHDRGTRIKALLIRPPCLQRATGSLKHPGCLTLGDALGLQVAIPLKQRSAFEAIPALGAIIVASLRLLDDCAHSSLLCNPSPLSSDGSG